jgi:hypothetical protein
MIALLIGLLMLFPIRTYETLGVGPTVPAWVPDCVRIGAFPRETEGQETQFPKAASKVETTIGTATQPMPTIRNHQDKPLGRTERQLVRVWSGKDRSGTMGYRPLRSFLGKADGEGEITHMS